MNTYCLENIILFLNGEKGKKGITVSAGSQVAKGEQGLVQQPFAQGILKKVGSTTICRVCKWTVDLCLNFKEKFADHLLGLQG